MDPAERSPQWLHFEDAHPAEKKLGHANYGFTLPTGVEHAAVLNSVVEQLKHVADTLSDCEGIA